VPGKDYIFRQAQFLLRFAKSTSDPELSAKLISKAADLMSESDFLPDVSVAPPDVEADNQAKV
jgi:hypothetical protein